CDLTTYVCKRLGTAEEIDENDGTRGNEHSSRFGRRRFARRNADAGGTVRSPDGKWEAFVRDGNVFIRNTASADENKEGNDAATIQETQLNTDGTATVGYGELRWAPDSTALVAFRTEPGDRKEVYLVESSPKDGGRAKLRSRPYDLPGDKLTT